MKKFDFNEKENISFNNKDDVMMKLAELRRKHEEGREVVSFLTISSKSEFKFVYSSITSRLKKEYISNHQSINSFHEHRENLYTLTYYTCSSPKGDWFVKDVLIDVELSIILNHLNEKHLPLILHHS